MKETKNMKTLTVWLALFTMTAASSFGHVDPARLAGKNPNQSALSLAAGCSPPKSTSDMAFNNVRSRIHTGGDMWWDLVGAAVYEVPKGSGKHALFAGSLWLGGQDVNGQLKLAAMRFRDGIDFWTGPLTIGAAEIDAPTCAAYDQHYGISVNQVALFNSWFNATQTADPDDDLEFIGYEIPDAILNWPAHGDVSVGQSFYVAPFYDRNGDGRYDPYSGDYPYYDIERDIECTSERTEKLYGDTTLWWVFNDKGNVHTETGGSPIGMEIHAQAFAFATNDEINNMTFYNYRLINRSTFTLTNTYFGVWTDADLGHHLDDYVGCDVMRGLGYTYNGLEVDGTGGPTHYGIQPPAVGIDFFEGPYQDNDGIANDVGIGFNEALNGIGYGDTIIDNERFGMRRFLYFNNGTGNPATHDPQTASDYYNFLRSIWKDQTQMFYGGTGHQSDPNADQNFPTAFMFPGDSDPQNWGTGGVDPGFDWDEYQAGNLPADRRFVQSAGPFVLRPGAVNDITVGAVWARGLTGGPRGSLERLRVVDDKAQSLFENCFRILDGPDAPEMTIHELDRELIIVLSNRPSSNNSGEDYADIDPFIPETEESIVVSYVQDPNDPTIFTQVVDTTIITNDRFYRFQGYQIFQVKNADVSISDLYNTDLSRLVAQVDIRDSVSRLINFNFDENLQAAVPQEMVNGDNTGIRKTFRITDDQFASGDKRLVNHKTYYYMAVAYAHNNYKTYSPQNPQALDGQQKPYLAGRRGATQGENFSVSGVPHIPLMENNGTLVNSVYGEGPYITRLEGSGNGGNILDFTIETEDEIMSGEPWKSDFPVYQKGRGPVNIKVVDPLSVPNAEFKLLFDQPARMDTSRWTLINLTSGDSIRSTSTIKIQNEQVITEWGISVTIEQVRNPGVGNTVDNGYLDATLEFEDPSNRWLTGIADLDGTPDIDWIRSGSGALDYAVFGRFKDSLEIYERMGVPFFAPYALAAYSTTLSLPGFNSKVATGGLSANKLDSVESVDIVFTSDQSKWTRCPVIEVQNDIKLNENSALKGGLRQAPSVGKDGKPDGTGTGMSWFPGYAISLETGERLNMAFAEDSWLVGENGRDMIWNPSPAMTTLLGTPVLGGRHYIYVFNNTGAPNSQPLYDEGKWMEGLLASFVTDDLEKVWQTAMWVGFPMLEPNHNLLSSDARVRLRVAKEYKRYDTPEDENNSYPHYTFNTADMAVTTGSPLAMETALSLINVVPNPYYAFSEYETNQLDNRIKIINLPEECVVTIYTMSGTLIRRINKADPTTSVDWDLENHAGIPIASGVYLIHVDVPNVGERVIKWFGVKRPVDLQSF